MSNRTGLMLLAALTKLMPRIGTAQAPTFATLYSFQGGADGTMPNGGVILGKHGSLYGTTVAGGNGNVPSCNINGTYHCGTVFELAPANGGSWTHTVLYNFNGPDGGLPGASLVFNGTGTLYGTTGVS